MDSFNQQKPVFNKLQVLTAIASVVIVGGVGLSFAQFSKNKSEIAAKDSGISEQVKPAPTPTPQPEPQPATNTQIVILIPDEQIEIDCIRYGGGMGCFEKEYVPEVPQYYSEKPVTKRGKIEFKGSDAAWRIWE